MKFLVASVLLLLIMSFSISCSKDEIVEVNYPINLNLALETNWDMANEILVLINEHRVSIGLSEIKSDQKYASAYAVEHTKYMIELNKISHDNFFTRSEALKSKGALAVGEVVAYGFITSEGVVNAWLRSPGHKKVIEGRYNYSGFGVIKNAEGGCFFTLLFYRK